MNETTKKAVLIVVAVAALAIAGFSAMKMMKGDEMIVDQKVTLPAGHKSEKEKALESGGKSGGEKDLGG